MSRFIIIAVAALVLVAAIFMLTSDDGRPIRPTVDMNSESDASEHHALEFTSNNFDQLVKKADKPVLVDFWAPWCGPCVGMTPAIEKLAAEYEGKVVIGKLNIDQAPDIDVQHRAKEGGIPLIVFYNNGQIVEQLRGAQTEDELREVIDILLEP